MLRLKWTKIERNETAKSHGAHAKEETYKFAWVELINGVINIS